MVKVRKCGRANHRDWNTVRSCDSRRCYSEVASQEWVSQRRCKHANREKLTAFHTNQIARASVSKVGHGKDARPPWVDPIRTANRTAPGAQRAEFHHRSHSATRSMPFEQLQIVVQTPDCLARYPLCAKAAMDVKPPLFCSEWRMCIITAVGVDHVRKHATVLLCVLLLPRIAAARAAAYLGCGEHLGFAARRIYFASAHLHVFTRTSAASGGRRRTARWGWTVTRAKTAQRKMAAGRA